MKHMSKQTPPSFDDDRQAQCQWIVRTFLLEGVVRDWLRVSDAYDLHIYIYIYICIYVYVYMYMCICIYVYI